MNDELKEYVTPTLEYLRICVEDDIRFETSNCKALLDYITNLQERKITKEDVDKYFEENMCVSFDKFIENWKEQEKWTNYYKKENERLKENKLTPDELANLLNQELIKQRDELISSNTKLREEKLMYKLRIDKAIEWIYLNADYIKGRVDSFRRLDALKLLNILGGDEE